MNHGPILFQWENGSLTFGLHCKSEYRFGNWLSFIHVPEKLHTLNHMKSVFSCTSDKIPCSQKQFSEGSLTLIHWGKIDAFHTVSSTTAAKELQADKSMMPTPMYFVIGKQNCLHILSPRVFCDCRTELPTRSTRTDLSGKHICHPKRRKLQ